MTAEPVTEARLAEIEARANAATPGQWEFDELPFRYKVRTPQRHRAAIIVHAGDTVHNIPNYGSPAMGRADAAFIAGARSDVPALVAEVRRLRRELAQETDFGEVASVRAVDAEYRATAAEAKLAEAVKVLRLVDEAVHPLFARGFPLKQGGEPIDHMPLNLAWDAALKFLATFDKETPPRSGNRVTYDDAGELDEVVTDGGAHLERMDKDRWFLNCARADGTSFAVWIKGKVTHTEERRARAKETTP